ncbi:MAG TPA: hypothetical protein VFK05_16625 [Polyangiaceae bacterium]|nr:hypothetical protein [Polyangiaceae bacterium]
MPHFVFQRFVRLTLYATLARCALACGADSDHGPPIGSPTGPAGPVITEGGSANPGGQGGANPTLGGSATSLVGGGFDTATGGSNSFGAAGVASAGRDPFGIGGAVSGSDPFGSGGTASPFSGMSSF